MNFLSPFYPLARSALFKLDPEVAHNVALLSLKKLEKAHLAGFLGQRVVAPREVFGLCFDNAIGLAAGLDKNGEYIDAMAALGFGFIEVGTVTPRAQPGNPKPRLFRIPSEGLILNRMGFNSEGAMPNCAPCSRKVASRIDRGLRESRR